MNKVMSWVSLAVIFSTLLCWLSLNNLPENYASYVPGWFVVAVLGGPFIIIFFLIRKTPLPNQTMTNVAMAILALMALIDLMCQGMIYTDQLNTSRGFALLACGAVYVCGFVPLWITFLIIVTIIKKRISREHLQN